LLQSLLHQSPTSTKNLQRKHKFSQKSSQASKQNCSDETSPLISILNHLHYNYCHLNAFIARRHRKEAMAIVNTQENLKRFLMIHKTRSKSFGCHCRDHHQKRFKMILKTALLTEALRSGLQPQKNRQVFEDSSSDIRHFTSDRAKSVEEFPDWFLDERFRWQQKI
jgi:hypothetical protein